MTASLYTPGGLPLPDLDDPPNVPADLLALAGELDLRVENRFGTTGDRDATLPAGTTPIGSRCLVLTTGRRYIVWPTATGNQWFELRSGRLVVTTDTVRDSLLVTPDGMEIYNLAAAGAQVRSGSTWLPVQASVAQRQQSVGGSVPVAADAAWVIPAGLPALVLGNVGAGTWIELGVSYACTNDVGDLRIDFGTYVANTLVSYVSGTGATGHGVVGLGSIGGRFETGGGTVPYQLTAADVSAGTVNARLLVKANSGARTIFAIATDPLLIWGRVLG